MFVGEIKAFAWRVFRGIRFSWIHSAGPSGLTIGRDQKFDENTAGGIKLGRVGRGGPDHIWADHSLLLEPEAFSFNHVPSNAPTSTCQCSPVGVAGRSVEAIHSCLLCSASHDRLQPEVVNSEHY
ncbi:unnamed protein product [Protopolystoma xenopodis]|uniref:Uncharacterized protein n=1 Tax=Protopolystoma xenopodis TaxID=117903 RepID=A0A448WAD8_9PLAT|nr:unnamed protein product [Protopolystoma xenopodis]